MVIRIARERTIVKLAVISIAEFLDYLIYREFFDGSGMREKDFRKSLLITNFFALTFRYLLEVSNISNFTGFILNNILRQQRSKEKGNPPPLDVLEGAWIILPDGFSWDTLKEDTVPMSDELYFGVIYPTARILEALGMARGISTSTLLRGLNFIARLLDKVEVSSLETKLLVPIIDAAIATYDKLPYDKIQGMIVPMVTKLRDIVYELDPSLESLYSQDVIMKSKALTNEGLVEEDIDRINRNLESKVLKRVLSTTYWLTMFNVDVSPRIQEMILDLLSKNFSAVFDIHKDPLLAYFISNAEVLARLIQTLSDKKFAQIVLDRTIEHVSDLVLHGVSNIFEATKLLTVTKVLMEARGVIRR